MLEILEKVIIFHERWCYMNDTMMNLSDYAEVIKYIFACIQVSL